MQRQITFSVTAIKLQYINGTDLSNGYCKVLVLMAAELENIHLYVQLCNVSVSLEKELTDKHVVCTIKHIRDCFFYVLYLFMANTATQL